ncbi:MAG: HAMP domain-containing histidine kinase [Epsilonproteobacteria bacterium]|jgi:two-component system OmpR family sensor kinase|nr:MULTISPECIES: ArsS family sensor histidine kinase [Sulfurospirillum]MDY0264113.1 ArsS family sensor histidine kinase [Sulfurospirillum cavolei]NCB54544.1 HAMP domain-containing histidine kinase [Campylobacterota bacterium]KHG34291.1 MAG: ATPase [Sulfurospirillum sp. MES]MCP3650988.1 ArsS family sensor histidine kinase [Sulfurospirillum sp. DNRA8]MCR1809834.1 ArsS family sensor histidine kinase [Sulfurospirillum sp. DNRA8]
MTKSSIFYSITFIFAISIVSIFLALLFLLEYDKQTYTEKLNIKYSIIARATLFHLNNFITNEELKKQVQGYQMREITDKAQQEHIIQNAQVIQKISDRIGSSAILRYENDHYLQIETKYSSLLLKDEDFQPYRYDLIKTIFGVVFTIIIIAYILTIRKIKPLRKLKRQMDAFAKGNLTINCKTDGEDEISQVANAFHNAVEQINKLNQSRQLFLRNIMHELKTPITKGRISAEMLEEGKQRTRLIGTFEKLELLINEFASIEQITSGEGLKNVKPYRLVDMLDEAIDLAMISPTQIEIDGEEEIILNVDFRLFTTAMKNVIDNGIKYSIDQKVRIVARKTKMAFISQGKPLKYELAHYLEPFVQENNSHHSFGLGLYIVHHILKAHRLTFTYEHKDGYNYFNFEKLDTLEPN